MVMTYSKGGPYCEECKALPHLPGIPWCRHCALKAYVEHGKLHEQLVVDVNALQKVHDLAGELSSPDAHPHIGAIMAWCDGALGGIEERFKHEKLLKHEFGMLMEALYRLRNSPMHDQCDEPDVRLCSGVWREVLEIMDRISKVSAVEVT
jgi:hypothetical protein